MTKLANAIPPRVTRFYGCVEYGIDVVESGQIAFVHVSRLNDPFDPYFFFETDFGDSYNNLIRYVKENHPGEVSRFRVYLPAQNWINTVQKLKAYLQEMRATTFVLSTCAARGDVEPKDNLYMWGHYANGHRGLALEFDTNALASAVLQRHEAENAAPSEGDNVWAKIAYAETFPPITGEHL